MTTRWLAWSRRWPLPVAKTWHADVGRLADAAARSGTLVVLDQLTTASYRPAVGRYIVALQNVESRLWREAPRPSSRLRRWEHDADGHRVARLERRVVTDLRAQIVVVSDVDAAALGGRCHVIPNGTDLPADPPHARPRGGVLFVGSLDYAPNRAGLAWWATEVWPQFPAPRPVLDVVGRGGATALGGLADHPSLRVIGEVASVDPYLSATSVVVIPLLHGGGTRLKVLEAMAWARPVVTTSKGAEGLPVRHRRDAWLADEPADFAQGVSVALTQSEEVHGWIGTARRLAEQYSWEKLADEFADLVLGEVG